MSPRLIQAALGGLLLLSLLAALSLGTESCFKGKVSRAEQQAAQAKGEANTHAAQAQSIPDHAADLAQAQANVDRARAEVQRLRKLLDAKPSLPIPDPDGPGSPIAPIAPSDDRDQTIHALGELVSAQDAQIGTLKLALSDKTRQSDEWKAAFEAERRRSAGLEIALDAQKHVSASGKWVGRFQGFAAGVALGYVGGKR